jgi:hypothetical protein
MAVPPPQTQREALVALANAMADLVQEASGDGLTFETAIAAIMGALVTRGADYQYNTLGALTMDRSGRARVTMQDLGVLQEILVELKGLRREAQLRTGIIGD